jgi:predicted  nucleic acid-binding Zn-ribbon protein
MKAPMSKITLKMIWDELRKGFSEIDTRLSRADSRFDEIEARVDSGFELMKEQIQNVDHKVDKVAAELRSEMSSGFDKVHVELKVIRRQTAHVTERVAKLEQTDRVG